MPLPPKVFNAWLDFADGLGTIVMILSLLAALLSLTFATTLLIPLGFAACAAVSAFIAMTASNWPRRKV